MAELRTAGGGPFLRIHPGDNVAVALSDLPAGFCACVDQEETLLLEPCPAKQKFLLQDVPPGGAVRMYGTVVGRTIRELRRGEVISTTNLCHDASAYEVRKSSYVWRPPPVTRWKERTFRGYYRSDGQIGTRNHWIVVPLVFCENRDVEYMRNALLKRLGYAVPDAYEHLVSQLVDAYATGLPHSLRAPSDHPIPPRTFKNVDGIKFLRHDGGCGGTRQDSETLCRLLAGYLNNPNVAGGTVLSLGCQNAQPALLQQVLRDQFPHFDKPVLVFERQRYPTERALLTDALTATFHELERVNRIERQPAPLSKLCVGLKCGGSDGFSGITANPAMGHVSDLLVALGGRTLLAEFPELRGVEQELIDRCVRVEDAEKFTRLMSSYSHRAREAGSGFDMNPSPGNIRDGLITGAMKSAGAARKGGTAPVSGVLDYAEYAVLPGLHLLCTPGNDVEATTGMAGSGANLIVFSTGLGTPTGNPVAPVVKTATNSDLARRMPDIIDFDHGDVIDQGAAIESSGEHLLEKLIRFASGEAFTCAEILQQEDFIPWKRGVSL